MESSDIHVGHRNRVKKRFLQDGLDGFEQHNVLEMLLFYAIPRADTNVMAHELIKQFGKISEVFDAPYEELIKVTGVSENVAILIKMIPSLSRCYMQDKNCTPKFMDSVEKIGEFFKSRYIGVTQEIIYLMCLDSSLCVISCEELARGCVDEVNVNIRKIVELVVKHNACSVVMAHNHPRGLAMPSNADVTTSLSVLQSLKLVGVKFIDHIIVAQNDFASLARLGYLD